MTNLGKLKDSFMWFQSPSKIERFNILNTQDNSTPTKVFLRILRFKYIYSLWSLSYHKTDPQKCPPVHITCHKNPRNMSLMVYVEIPNRNIWVLWGSQIQAPSFSDPTPFDGIVVTFIWIFHQDNPPVCCDWPILVDVVGDINYICGQAASLF